MTVDNGFSLIELLVVLIILGVAATFTIPSFVTSIEQSKAQTAKNNLIAISAAQQRYFEDNGSYYNNNSASPCTNSVALINTNLNLSMMANDPFCYVCSTTATTYSCTASHNTVTLSVGPNTLVSCLSGGSRCPS